MRGRLAEIDMLRGYAVAMVVFLHLNLSNPYRGWVVLGINAIDRHGDRR